MKIVINAYSARVGGGKTYLINLLGNLPADPELEIHLFAHPSLNLAEDSRIRRVSTTWPVTNPLLRTIWERLALPAYLRRVGADVLFCPGGVVATRAPAGCRVATMFRNMLPFDLRARQRLGWGLQRLRNHILRFAMLRSMAHADLTIFISDYARAVVEKLIHIPHPVTIPHGVAAAFRTFDREVPLPERAGEGEYILYVSRFDVYKHHREVVDAYAALPASARRGIRLLFAGEHDSNEFLRVRAHVAALGLQDRVIFLGSIPYGELPGFYRHARIILFASSCENCPNILLEALGAGRPLASSNVMPMPEFGGPGISYFSPFDPASIRSALGSMLTQPAIAEEVAEAAAERSRAYDWHKTASATWAQLLALRGSR